MSEIQSSGVIKVGVLMGGPSSEHEVSLSSGNGVVRALSNSEYVPIPIIIHKDFQWEFPNRRILTTEQAVAELKEIGIDVVFIALHGAYGEDGRIQGLLEWLNIPYTGSSCSACALAMNKPQAKAVVKQVGVTVAEHILFRRENWMWDKVELIPRVFDELGLPVVVKPACQGSSVGISIVRHGSSTELEDAIQQAFEYDTIVMVEQYIQGVEVTCGVWDCDESQIPKALPVTEIRPKSSAFFDYTAKYTAGASEEITPARISESLTNQVQQFAVKAHVAIGCSTWSRSDFIIGEKGPIWIEINTIPGLTPTSLYPQETQCAGISYDTMIRKFVEHALRKRTRSDEV